MPAFWHWFVAAGTIVFIIWCIWLISWSAKQGPQNVSDDDLVGHFGDPGALVLRRGVGGHRGVSPGQDGEQGRDGSLHGAATAEVPRQRVEAEAEDQGQGQPWHATKDRKLYDNAERRVNRGQRVFAAADAVDPA